MSDLISELEDLSGPGWVKTNWHAEEAENAIRVGRMLGLGPASVESAERDGVLVSVLTMTNRPKLVFVARGGSFGRSSVKEALEASGLLRVGGVR